MTGNLFDPPTRPDQPSPNAPLAQRMRPSSLEEFLGQGHLLDKGKFLREAIEADRVPSMIFWGPPGVGKTTLAGIIARSTDSRFFEVSAVLSGIKEVRRVIQRAEQEQRMHRRRTPRYRDARWPGSP